MEAQFTNTENTKYTLTWNEYDEDIRKLADMIYNYDRVYDYVYGIPRGGQIIAVHISHLIGIPYSPFIYQNTLIVDDVSDTGKTLKEHLYQGLDTATLYRKDGTLHEPTFCIRTINKYINFPWEY